MVATFPGQVGVRCHLIFLMVETLVAFQGHNIATITSICQAIDHRAGSVDPSVSFKQLLGRMVIALWQRRLMVTLPELKAL